MKSIITPAYQPIFDIQSKRISHFEALLRIKTDPSGTAHVDLIRHAERHHFIQFLDLAMCELVLQDARSHTDTVAINVSPMTVEYALPELAKFLAEYADLTDRLIIELTETTPVQDCHKVHELIEAAHLFGARVAVDDFGTNNQTFREPQVRALRPDFLKLDGSVLREAMATGDFSNLAEARELARAVGAEVIAEFVDSDEKIAALHTVGIRYAQGAAFGMPITREEIRRPSALVVGF